MRSVLTLLLTAVTIASVVVTAESSEVEPWDRVICIQTQVESKPDTGKLCSAFLVKSEDELFLVNAGHAAAETNQDSRLRYRDPEGKTQWVALGSFVQGSGDPWHRDAVSDLAIARLPEIAGAEIYLKHFRGLALPLKSICKDAPPRTTAIVTAGFPLAIGSQDEVSAVAVVGHIASNETVGNTLWGNEPIIFCSPALAQGTSGGPTFLQSATYDEVKVVGMYIGVVRDVTGAKLSKLVPARIIHESIERL